MQQGMIFNIQRFSIHDGPGIRTAVFFKGCPLRCRWCSNPESQQQKVQILYDEHVCLHCKKCVDACMIDAIHEKNDHIEVDDHVCNGCLQCVQVCPGKALRNEGEHTTIACIVEACCKDIDFYEESHGGITLTGGECFFQPLFLKELILALKKHNLSIALETTGYTNHSIFQDIAPLCDLLLYDVKHYDEACHLQQCGVSNKQILANLQWAIEHDIQVLPRIPVIPGFNDQHMDAEKLADLLLSLHCKRVQLLPFHQFGEKKYDLLHQSYTMKDVHALHPEDLIAYQHVFLAKGLDCFF